MNQAVEATCPFCGLLCDDVVVASNGAAIEVREKACALGARGLGRPLPPAVPRVAGEPASREQALDAAARLLAAAQAPLFAGLATDVAGMRAVMRLADRCGAVLDHMNGPAAFRNQLALQEGGWIATTLSEVRNRADLVVLAGCDPARRFPRFFERCVWVEDTLFGLRPAEREVVVLGAGIDAAQALAPDGRAPLHLACDISRLGEAFAVLRALTSGIPLQAESAAGLPMAAWQDLAQRLARARYAVIVWAAADLDFLHAELTVAAMAGLIEALNRKTRAAGLPLGGSDGDFTADGVELWQTGFPFRTSFAGGVPHYDPYRHHTERLLAEGEVDAMLWISAFDAERGPPATTVPTVALGRPGMKFAREPEVFIPVGTPGLDHGGHLLRADKVVILPLRQLREAGLPGAAQVIGDIEARLPC
jgi:formylmethanofuran dehydrogenase subunit B